MIAAHGWAYSLVVLLYSCYNFFNKLLVVKMAEVLVIMKFVSNVHRKMEIIPV